MNKNIIMFGLVCVLLCSFASAYKIDGNTVFYDSVYANMSVRPHTVSNPNYQWQEFTVNSKAAAGDLCVAYVFNEPLLSGSVQLHDENMAHPYQQCEEDEQGEMVNCETAYAYYPDWYDVTSAFTNITVNDKIVYYHITPLSFDAWDNQTWRIRYQPQASEGKWDLWTWNSQTGNCYNDYVLGSYDFLYELDPWWNSNNMTEGYIVLSDRGLSDILSSYNWTFGFPFEAVLGAGAATQAIDTSRVQGERSLKLTLAAGDNQDANDNINSWNCDGDRVVVWFKHSDITKPRPADKRLGVLQIGQNATSNYFATITNDSSGDFELNTSNVWTKIDLPKSDFTLVGAGSWLAIDYLRVRVYGETGSGVSAWYDDLYCYNSSNYFNTSRWTIGTGDWEQQPIDNGFGYNSTQISFYKPTIGTEYMELTDFNYTNFESIVQVTESQDLGTNQLKVRLMSGVGTSSLSLALIGGNIWYKTDIGGTTDSGVGYNQDEPVLFKFLVNNTFHSYYYSFDFGITWNLVINFTSAVTPDGLSFIGQDAQGSFDNIVIRELINTTQDIGYSALPSFIYQDSEEDPWNTLSCEWYLADVLQQNATVTNPSDQNTCTAKTLNDPGEWYVNVRVCDDGDNCAINSSQNITINSLFTSNTYTSTTDAIDFIFNTTIATNYTYRFGPNCTGATTGQDTAYLNDHLITQSSLNDNVTYYFNVTVYTALGLSETECFTTRTKSNTGNLTINIYDEKTEALITNRTVVLNLVGPLNGNYTTTTGTLSINEIPSGDYELRYGATDYYSREYYFTIESADVSLIELFLLNKSDGERVIITLYNQNSDVAENITVKIQRNYVSGNVSIFKTVAMTKTNFDGRYSIAVQLYDVWYKLIYVDITGKILKITDPTPFFDLVGEDSVNLLEDTYESWREIDNVLFNVTFVNQTGTVYARFIYIDTTNLVREGCLNVKRVTALETYAICYNCTTASSATISCLINPALDGEYKAVGLIDTNTTNSWYTLDSAFFNVYDTVTYAQEGIFFSAIIVGTMALMGIGSVTGSLVLMVLGLIATILLEFVVGFSLGYIYWIVILAFIIIFLIVKGRK